MRPLALLIFVLSFSVLAAEPATRIALRDGRWSINARVTNLGSATEGLLMNVRMVNAVFEDRSKPDFDPEKNTDRFIAQIGDYAAQGVNAFTICLQGGMPGYEGALNSAFEADGRLRDEYLKRVERVIRACDQRGVAIILGLYYQRQSAVLKDEQAVRAGVVNAARWVRERGFQNVVIEIANEYPHSGFVHPVLREPKGIASLIRLAKENAPGLLVSASGIGDGKVDAEVAEAGDFLLPHWNGVPVEQIPARLAELKRYGKSIVCNEDDKQGEKAVAAMKATIGAGAGYGLMLQKHNQWTPFHFDGAADDPLYYTALKAATSGKEPGQAGAPGSRMFKGRIAYSADGNHNDPDDWAASPVALAIFAEAGLRDRVVHFDYNCILPQNNPEFERIHAESVLGTVERYGYDRTRFFDCRKELDRAVADLTRAINESSADNPLWFIVAGPMEVPYLAIEKSDPAKRPFVHCISHSRWNDGYATKYTFTHTKRSVIEQDVRWVQIRDQNARLSTSAYGRPAREDEWQPYHWMRDSQDAKVRWLWERMVVSTRPDPSDAGMAWFLASGDEDCDPAKLQRLLDGHQAPAATMRQRVRLEAENFRHLDGFAVEDRKDKGASHQLEVLLKDAGRGRIRTTFDEPFTPAAERSNVDVRLFDEAGSRSQFTLLVNGQAQGTAWESAGEGKGWTTHTVPGVVLRAGDEIAVEVQNAPARIDYVQLNFANAPATPKPGAANAHPAARLRVAVVQMFVRPTLAENRDRIVAGIAQAAKAGARVAVFPEASLAGRGSEDPKTVDEAVEAIRRAAHESGINVLFGANTQLRSIGKTGNWMLAIGPDGRDVFRYEKLYDNHRAAMPGVFALDGVPCSTMICADRWLRGVVELPIQQGAQISLELSNNFACEWVPPYEWYWNVPLALRNTVWSVFANAANEIAGKAPSPAELKHGHSAIITPDGRVLAAAHSDTEELVIADLEIAQATRTEAQARAAHPALRPFWEAGLKLQRGEAIEAPAFKPLKSAEADITLAVAPAVGDLARIEAMIREARVRKADVIAFPAQAIPEQMLEPVRAAAKEHRITVVIGANHREKLDLHNSAYVFGPDGALLTRYDQLSASEPFQRGANAPAMWFRVKGVPAFVTIGRDALWTELSELAAVAGARLHIHLEADVDGSPAARQRRLETWANAASFLTFTAVVNGSEAILWDDLRGRDESRAVVKGLPQPDTGAVEVYSPFSANLVARAATDTLAVATRHVPAVNAHHPSRTSNLNPQMKNWYELGAARILPR
jgi:predicted amidohydrolase